MKRISCLPGGC